ncbi:hypothetical protein FRC06_004087 [Ceratobasidium sp. 370]|nr:hypothetical protein FRC06_004087 [Ceratobasidium sp. 370]
MNRPEQFTKVDLTPKRHHGYAMLLFIFGTFFPPLAVAARFGIGGDFWLNLLLTICGYFPGHGHNFYIQNIRNNKNHRRTPKWALRYGLVDDTEIQRRKRRSQWANRYDERLPQSALEGQEYEEGQNAGETPRDEQNDPFARRNGEPALWNETDESYYNGGNRLRPGSLRTDSQSSLSNRRWHYPANFNEATEVEGVELDGRKSKGKKKTSKRSKDKKDRWGRTADAHAGVGYEDVDGAKKKKKKRSKTTDDSMWSNRRSDTNLPRRHSSVSEIEGPEDAVGGLYGERTALRSAEEPRRDGTDPLEHQF